MTNISSQGINASGLNMFGCCVERKGRERAKKGEEGTEDKE